MDGEFSFEVFQRRMLKHMERQPTLSKPLPAMRAFRASPLLPRPPIFSCNFVVFHTAIFLHAVAAYKVLLFLSSSRLVHALRGLASLSSKGHGHLLLQQHMIEIGGGPAKPGQQQHLLLRLLPNSARMPTGDPPFRGYL